MNLFEFLMFIEIIRINKNKLIIYNYLYFSNHIYKVCNKTNNKNIFYIA